MLLQHHHLPAQQPPQLGTDDLFLLGADPLRDSLAYTRPRIRTRGRCVLLSLVEFTSGGFALTDGGGGEVVFFVDGVDGALEAAEEEFGADEGGGQVDGVGEFVDWWGC